MTDEPVPAERATTPRQAMRQLLQQGPRSARELSQEVGISEREVESQLEALGRGRSGLVVHPAQCVACGFSFNERQRVRKPGRCPQCRSERIAPPRFSVRSK